METTSIDHPAFLGALSGGLLIWSGQILLLLSLTWVVLKLDRSHSAATRYRIWLIALVAVSVMPLLSLMIQSLQLSTSIYPSLTPPLDTRDQITLAAIDSMEAMTFPWLEALTFLSLLVWVIGVIVSLARLGNSFWKLHKIRSRAQTVSVADINCSDPDLLLRPVSITLSKDIRSAGLAGFIRPTILLPADIVSWTNPEERTAILRHELAHLDRRDHLVSLFQSILKALLFFHPMVRIACNQLSLERELACDDRVIGLGTEPNAYAESILKVAERSFLTDAVHHTASYASKRKLERRIEMILDRSRVRPPLSQWQSLLLPVSLICIVSWLVIPAASNDSALENQATQSTLSIWTEEVKRGDMPFMVRGLGNLLYADNGKLKAQISLPELMARAVKLGQPARIDTRAGVVSGKVIGINLRSQDGIATIDISLKGKLPPNATSGLDVDGIIEVGRLNNILYVGRPVEVKADSTSSLFKLAPDGKTATRIRVRFGKISINTIEIIDGLQVGDRVIISDMSQYDGLDMIRLN